MKKIKFLLWITTGFLCSKILNEVLTPLFLSNITTEISRIDSLIQAAVSSTPILFCVYKAKQNDCEDLENNEYYKLASDEYITQKDEALWARLFADSNGDENKTKAVYIRLRAKKLKSLNPKKNNYKFVVLAFLTILVVFMLSKNEALTVTKTYNPCVNHNYWLTLPDGRRMEVPGHIPEKEAWAIIRAE